MVQKFTSEFRCEIFVMRSERRVSNYFVSIIMACELGEGGVLIVTLMRGWRGFWAVNCAPFSNKCKTTWSRTHGALYSTILERDWGIDARKGEGVQ